MNADDTADVLLFSKGLLFGIPKAEAEEKVKCLNREFKEWFRFMSGLDDEPEFRPVYMGEFQPIDELHGGTKHKCSRICSGYRDDEEADA